LCCGERVDELQDHASTTYVVPSFLAAGREVQSLIQLRDGHVVARRYHRLRSLKIQTNVRDGESNFTSIADVCGRRCNFCDSVAAAFHDSCLIFSDKQLHSPRRQSDPEWVIPEGKLATAPVLPRITLHRSLFLVTSVSRAGDAIRPFVADGRCHRGQMPGPD
jgi:hypothetical protein